MRVLDIDLDFFLNDCCELAHVGERPSVLGAEPWDEAAIVVFLEHNCGLNANKPINGALFETHDEALCFWDSMIKQNKLTIPFSVTHVDAHSDLGIGYPGPGYVLSNVLGAKSQIRCDIDRYYAQKQLDEANYLLFATAFRWIESLELVRNAKSRPDIPENIILRDHSNKYCALWLRSLVSSLFEGTYGKEPVIPLSVYDNPNDFCTTKQYDFVTVAQSPRYSPKEADWIIRVISKYINTSSNTISLA